jgi:hypothetical protein
MPQKKNPVTFEMIKAKSAHILGSFAAGCAVMKNTPFSLCMDLFETQSDFWAGFKSTLDAVNLFAETLKFVTFNDNANLALRKFRRVSRFSLVEHPNHHASAKLVKPFFSTRSFMRRSFSYVNS